MKIGSALLHTEPQILMVEEKIEKVLELPLSGYEEVKPCLLEMKALSQEGLGMVSRVSCN